MDARAGDSEGEGGEVSRNAVHGPGKLADARRGLRDGATARFADVLVDSVVGEASLRSYAFRCFLDERCYEHYLRDYLPSGVALFASPLTLRSPLRGRHSWRVDLFTAHLANHRPVFGVSFDRRPSWLFPRCGALAADSLSLGSVRGQYVFGGLGEECLGTRWGVPVGLAIGGLIASFLLNFMAGLMGVFFCRLFHKLLTHDGLRGGPFPKPRRGDRQ